MARIPKAERVDPKDELIALLKKDPQLKKFRNITVALREQIHIEKDRAEALSLHASRSSRTLYSKIPSAKHLLDASLKDMSFRSRMAEIRVVNTTYTSTLEEAVKAIKRHINTEYYDLLNEYSNVESKKNMIDRVVKTALELQGECAALIDLLDTLIKDIDQSGFGLRNAVEVMKLLDGAKGSRNI